MHTWIVSIIDRLVGWANSTLIAINDLGETVLRCFFPLLSLISLIAIFLLIPQGLELLTSFDNGTLALPIDGEFIRFGLFILSLIAWAVLNQYSARMILIANHESKQSTRSAKLAQVIPTALSSFGLVCVTLAYEDGVNLLRFGFDSLTDQSTRWTLGPAIWFDSETAAIQPRWPLAYAIWLLLVLLCFDELIKTYIRRKLFSHFQCSIHPMVFLVFLACAWHTYVRWQFGTEPLFTLAPEWMTIVAATIWGASRLLSKRPIRYFIDLVALACLFVFGSQVVYDSNPCGWMISLILVTVTVGFHVTNWMFNEAHQLKLRSAGLAPADNLPPRLKVRSTIQLIAPAILCLGIGVTFAAIPLEAGRQAGALATAVLASMCWSFLLAMVLVLLPQRLGWPSLLPFTLIFVFTIWVWDGISGDHLVAYTNPSAPGIRLTDEREGVGARLERWRKANGAAAADPIFVVAISGGGLRASYWATRVLAELDELTCGVFHRRVFAVSGVSGGSLGAAAYVSWLADQEEAADGPAKCSDEARDGYDPSSYERLKHFVGADYLSPILAALMFRDVIPIVFPFPALFPSRRGEILERTWGEGWHETFGSNHFALPFLSLYTKPSGPRLPSLVLNVTSGTTGKPVLISNIRMDVPNTIDIFRAGYFSEGLSLAGATHHSARFPLISPTGQLWRSATGDDRLSKASLEIIGAVGQDRSPRRIPVPVAKLKTTLVDGGFYDNSGALPIGEIVRQIRSSIKNAPVYALLITSEPQTADGDEDVGPVCGGGGPGERKAQVDRLGAVNSAVQAIFETRNARGRQSMLELVRAVGGCDHVFEFPVSQENYLTGAPVGWALSKRTLRQLDRQVRFYNPEALRSVAVLSVPGWDPGDLTVPEFID